MNVLKPDFNNTKSIDEAFKYFEERKDSLQCVVLLGLTKEGGQFLAYSKSSAMERSFLISFAQSTMLNWFIKEEGV